MPAYYEFREPNSFDELIALLHLRYNVYRASRLHKFCPENEASVDLDCYDLYSRHFGLYEHTGNASQPVGYVRMVTDRESTGYAVMSCTTEHATFYRHFGAQDIAGSVPFYCDDYDGHASILLLSPKTLPASMKGTVSRMAEAYAETGSIFYMPHNPDCFRVDAEQFASGSFAVAA